jgi:hypothetical protein
MSDKLTMAEHYTKATVEARVWCLKCNRATMHRIDSGQRGPCLECLQRPAEPKKEPTPITGNLFE